MISTVMHAFIHRHVLPDDIASVAPLLGGDLNESALITLRSGEILVARRPLREESPWGPTVRGQVAAQRLASSCGVPVPEIVATDAEGMIYRYVPGAVISPGMALHALWGPDHSAAETPEIARVAGRSYGLLHAHQGRGLGPVQPDGSDPGWTADAYSRVVAAAQLLERRPAGIAPDDIELAAEVISTRAPEPRSRFVHGDASPANTIVGDGRVVALIDFDAAAWADPAIDLAWWWYHSPHTADDFDRGCAEVSEPTDEETRWVYRFRLLLSLAEAIVDIDVRQVHRIGRMLAQGTALFR